MRPLFLQYGPVGLAPPLFEKTRVTRSIRKTFTCPTEYPAKGANPERASRVENSFARRIPLQNVARSIVSFPARLDRVHTYSAVVRIAELSRRQRENLRITGDVPFDRSTCRLALITHWVGIPGNDGDWTARATPLRGAPGLKSRPNREPRWMATS